jgi:Ino eighty subunit 1
MNLDTFRVGYLSRKALPIKKNDAEPLTRVDVQYDLLDYIFSDKKAVFTNQTAPSPSPKIPFCELYVNAIFNSSKCSKVLKEKMVETPAFAVELAKISLLTNVGRINTTMACASFITMDHIGFHANKERQFFQK